MSHKRENPMVIT